MTKHKRARALREQLRKARHAQFIAKMMRFICKEMVEEVAGSSTGRTPDCGSGDAGSSPARHPKEEG